MFDNNKKIMITNFGNAVSAIAGTIEKYGHQHNLSIIHTSTLDKDILLLDEDIHWAQNCDVLILQGTWGSNHEYRQFNKENINANHKTAVLNFYNQIFADIAQKRKIPFIVLETSTLSRIRLNYVDIDLKMLQPRYYRMAKNHWIHGNAVWCKHNGTNDRLEMLANNINNYYHKSVDLTLPNWKHNFDNNILILSGLEHDPTNNNVFDWIISTLKNIRRYTNRQVLIKPHPLSNLDYQSIIREFKNVTLVDNNTKIKDLSQETKVAVIDNSTSIFELIALGIPCFTNEKSFGAGLGNTDLSRIEDPYLANEEEYLEWARGMSYTEFTLDEYSDESILTYLRELINA